MSAKGRPKSLLSAQGRVAFPARPVAHDVYRTPPAFIEQALSHVVNPCPTGTWLEPSAGDGRICQMVRKVYPRSEVYAVELRQEEERLIQPHATGVFIGDFRVFAQSCGAYDRIFTNPPFTLAEDFIRLGVERLTPDGQMVLLLRLMFLASQSRYRGLWASPKTRPSAVHILTSRPSFIRGTTDKADYAWFEWSGQEARQTRLEWLPPVGRAP